MSAGRHTRRRSRCRAAGGVFTTPSFSSTKMAATAAGSMSGTAHGSIPFCSLTCRISTLAFFFGSATNGRKPKRSGASSSVAFTSSVFELHGSPAVAGLLSRSSVLSSPTPSRDRRRPVTGAVQDDAYVVRFLYLQILCGGSRSVSPE